jgi:hypothetical protein
MPRLRAVRFGAIVAALLVIPTLANAAGSDTPVTVGSPPTPFSQNKQNEPAIAVDAANPTVLVAGSNDEIDEQGCNGSSCPFTHGVGVSGVYFSFDSGASWTQPTYTGWTARNCVGGPCTPGLGAIGTLPWYAEAGLVSDGDPAVAFGPRPGPNGFSWSNGSRLYYGNLTSNFATTKDNETFRGAEAIAVSRTDDVHAAAASAKNAWMPPVIVSQQSSTTFSDKDQLWADNAASSAFFGTVYVCWASFVGQEKGHAAPAGLRVAVSRDGGATWQQHPVSAAANNAQRNPTDGCTVRTDSQGSAFVFGIGTVSSLGKQSFELMSVSHNGGTSWMAPQPVVGPVSQPGVFDPVQGRPVIDGVAGARSDLAPAPSVDIANGAPTGSDATDRIVMSYVSGTVDSPHVFFTESADRGATWATPRSIEALGDRGFYTAPAISPNGTDVYVVYNAFTTPFRTNTTDPRSLVGVVAHADVAGAGPTGAFSELHRGLSGDPRGSSANSLISEFLGDYVYAVATRTYGAAVWNDARNAADCPAVDAWRMALQKGDTSVPKPAPGQVCPATFGNSDIFGGSYTDPTP